MARVCQRTLNGGVPVHVGIGYRLQRERGPQLRRA